MKVNKTSIWFIIIIIIIIIITKNKEHGDK